MKRIIAVMVIILAFTLLTGCGGGGSSAPAGNGVTIKGKLNSGSFEVVSKSRFRYALWDYMIPVGTAHAAFGGRRVSTVAAVGSNGSYTETTPAIDGSFQLTVAPGASYVLTTLDGVSMTGTIQADTASGMDAFPITTSTLNTVNVGTVSTTGPYVAAGSNSVLSSLGTATNVSALYTNIDDFMVRLSNVDADVNGIIDHKENKRFNFFVQYHFKYSGALTRGGTLTYLSSLPAGSFGDPTTLLPTSYQFTLWERPVGATAALSSTVTWTGAVMHLPGAVNGVTTKTIDSFQDLPNDPDYPGRFIDIFSGGSATTPLTPPPGDYLFTSGTTTLIYLKNVKTQTIDTNLTNMLFPVGRITVNGSGQVTSVSWQWMKKTAGGNWVSAMDDEVRAIVSIHLLGLFDNTGNNKDFTLPIQASGTYAPTALPYTPNRAGFTWVDAAGFAYGLGDY